MYILQGEILAHVPQGNPDALAIVSRQAFHQHRFVFDNRNIRGHIIPDFVDIVFERFHRPPGHNQRKSVFFTGLTGDILYCFIYFNN